MERDKKREFATYYKLHLDRQLKSRAKREAVARHGIYVFIGGYSANYPYLKVLKSSYVATWKTVARELTSRLADSFGNAEDCFNLLLPRIERETYSRLASQAVNLSELDQQFTKQHGRSMTAREKELYANALNQQQESNPAVCAQKVRKIWLNSVVNKVRKAQGANRDNLQKAWADVVGSEAAMETILERIDSLKGIAYCSSTSSVRRFELQRKGNLPALLGKQLKLNIRKIVFR
ncbi:MAG: hypothetical protein LBH01_08270 [Verrucomicrobiales bacterium]|jgi:hypothetical protein|nr:hypothetical protein [Verrucomicrobiales bacterium]